MAEKVSLIAYKCLDDTHKFIDDIDIASFLLQQDNDEGLDGHC